MENRYIQQESSVLPQEHPILIELSSRWVKQDKPGTRLDFDLLSGPVLCPNLRRKRRTCRRIEIMPVRDGLISRVATLLLL